MYSMFLVFVPIIVHAQQRHCAFILSASTAIWLFAQFGLRDALLSLIAPYHPMGRSFFNAFAWQGLFVPGVILGCKGLLLARWPQLRTACIVAAVAFSAVCFCLRHNLLIHWNVDRYWIERSYIGPFRLLNVACVVFLVAVARTRLESFAFEPKLLCVLGKHSLVTFSLHLTLIYPAAVILIGHPTAAWWAQCLIVCGCITAMLAVAFMAEQFSAYSRRRATHLTSAAEI